MKNLFKTLLIILFFTSIQSVQAQFKFGIKGGLNGNNIYQNIEYSDDEINTKMQFGYHFGAIVNYGFIDALDLQSGLIFSSKGYHIDLNGESYEGSQKVKINYIEIPLNLTINIKNFQASIGPYIAIGINGKLKNDYKYFDYEGATFIIDNEIKLEPVYGEIEYNIYREIEVFNAIDYGLNFGLGYQIKFILINVGYSRGLKNIIPENEIFVDYADSKINHNRNLTLSVNYFFGK